MARTTMFEHTARQGFVQARPDPREDAAPERLQHALEAVEREGQDHQADEGRGRSGWG